VSARRHRVRAAAVAGAAAIATVGATLTIGAGASGAAIRPAGAHTAGARAHTAGARARTAEARAHTAGVLDGEATAHLHLVQVEGSELSEEGPVAGVLTGTARGVLRLGAVFMASFTIHTRNGSITGRGTATPHGTGRYQSFAGSFTAIGGSGRYAHIHGRAGLYGVLDRRTDSVVIQTTGRLSY
jgi:hypothetical protein